MTGLFGTSGRMHHLLTLEHMPRAMLEHLLGRAQDLAADAEGGVARRHVLAGKAVCTLFFEPSTRTRSSFSLGTCLIMSIAM